MNSKQILRAACVSLACVAFAAAPAQAQMTWTDRGFVNVNFGVQEVSRTLTTETSFDLYQEQGQLSTSQPIDGGAIFDFSVGYKVWRNLALGIGYSRVKSDGDAAIAASVPDPNFFDRPRAVTGIAPNAEHSENAVHIQGTWVMPVTDKFDAAFSFGPTIFMVKQEIPTSIGVREPGGAIASTEVVSADKTTLGVNLGIDLNYFFTPRIGAGVLARYTVGSADIDEAEESLTVGGFQIAGGIRFRF